MSVWPRSVVVVRVGVAADVRGPGLFIGVALTDADLTSRVQNEMRNRGVLVGRTGPQHNVLKIRPPLVFEQRHADILLGVLEAAMGDVL